MVESSKFSSKFIAMKTCTEHIILLKFKLRMFGVDIDGPTIMLNNNKIVVNNNSKIESTLSKKHRSISYHLDHHNFAAGLVKIGWMSTADNIADASTKILTESKKKILFGNWTY